MITQSHNRRIDPNTSTPKYEEIGDVRFRALLTKSEWNQLPHAVRQRFSKKVDHGAVAIYMGNLTTARASKVGKILAQVLRLIGAPLPLGQGISVPAIVSVSEDTMEKGQIWTRIYGSKKGFPQVIQSAKRFSGPTGLKEYIGFGVTMTLRAMVEERSLIFRSVGFYFSAGPFRITLPQWLSPGRVTVRHQDLQDGFFNFSLQLDHPLFGELIYQAGIYQDKT